MEIHRSKATELQFDMLISNRNSTENHMHNDLLNKKIYQIASIFFLVKLFYRRKLVI